RIECLKNICTLIEEDGIKEGAVAELGVYRGEFAKEINKVFSNRKIYLFDTFEGFSMTDCDTEIKRGYAEQNRAGYFSNTTEQIVMEKMEYPSMCRICKGFFPDSAEWVEDEFCFVNLDADLYAPTLAGLEFFYPRLVKGGVILVHDYFSKAFHGVKDAVKEYCDKNQIMYLPIGDTLSVAIRKSVYS
ncbi:MAG TPA: methyltransferase, partial [Lachnospiraceae bacterium]|nr:methyltransferase [Lachnospiraceae bacterium]